MTLVVCRKEGNDVFIQSDSKVTDEFGASTERDLRQNLPLSGLLKTVFLHPHVCLSFAGQSAFATKFLKDFVGTNLSEWNTPRLVADLFDIHRQSDQGCEFVLCVSEDRKSAIVSIKDGAINADVPNAWIGSQDGFEAYQAAFHQMTDGTIQERMRSAFKTVIENPDLPEIGHFHIEAYLDHRICDANNDSVFLYELKTELDTGSQVIHVPARTRIALPLGEAAFGAFGTSYFRSLSTMRHAVAIHFPHGQFGVLLCPQVDPEMPVLLENCDARQFIGRIWDDFAISMEGIAPTSDTRLQLLRTPFQA